jgi:outer membrane protein TolC
MKLFFIIWISTLCFKSFGAQPISFDQALDKILERSTDIRVQQTQVEAADYGVLQKKGSFLPNLALSASRGNSIGSGTYSGAQQSGALTSSINLFRWGADVKQLEGAREDLNFQQNSLGNVKLLTEELAVETLSDQIQTGQEITVLKKNADAFHLYLEIAQQRFSHGLLPSQEVDKVALDFSNAEARLQDAISRQALAKANLARLLGREDDVKDEWPWKLKLKSSQVSNLLAKSPNFDERPDIRAAQSSVNAENARVKGTYMAQFPSLDFSASGGLSEYEDGSNQVSTTSLNLNLPLFDKLAFYSAHKIQYEVYAAADLRLRQLRLDAESQWSAAKDQFAISLKTALDRDKSLEISQRLYQTNDQRFKQGRASANDLEVDHRRLIDASLLAIAGWSSAHIQYAKLCHSLGRSVKSCW